MNTPWGPSQTVKTIAPGVQWVETGSHGGLKLSPAVWARIMAVFPTQKRYAPDGWLEEDCDWALAPLACPELFSERECAYAVRTFENYSGDYGAPAAAFLKTDAAAAVRTKGELFKLGFGGES